jgi:segregation and condensation protein B
MDDLKNIIESLLFVAETPISLDRFKEVLEAEDTKEIRQALELLSGEYDQRKSGIFLSEVAGGYQIRTRPEYHEYVKRLLKPSAHRLSNAALETLAIIAYKQPIIRADIEHLRGVDCGGVLRVLMEKKLVRVLGRKEIPGRPLIYATTKHFLEVFELKNLKDLPSPKEIERHTDLPQEKLAAAALFDSNVGSESPEQGETDSSENQTGEMATPSSDDHTGETETPPLEDQVPPPPEERIPEQEDASGEEKSLDLNDQSPI